MNEVKLNDYRAAVCKLTKIQFNQFLSKKRANKTLLLRTLTKIIYAPNNLKTALKTKQNPLLSIINLNKIFHALSPLEGGGGGGGLGWKLRQMLLTGRFYYLATWTEGLSCYEVVNSVGGSEWCTIRALKRILLNYPIWCGRSGCIRSVYHNL